MNLEEKIKRINELYHLSQVRELTGEEKEEQKALRQEYVLSVRNNLKGQLDNMYFVNPDGTQTKCKPKKK